MKNCLFISVNYPPLGGVGVQRITKIIKYLNKLDYKTTVITIPTFSVRKQKDPSMIEDLPPMVKVLRPFYFDYKKIVPGDLSKLLKPFERKYLFPDNYKLWNFFVLRQLKTLLLKQQFAVIFINVPPFSSIELIPKIKEICPSKLVLNMRDPFSFNNYNILKNNTLKQSRSYDMEKAAFEATDKIVFVTPSHLKNYSNLFPEHVSKFCLITNGFDDDDFRENSSIQIEKKFFKIAYSGSFSSLAPIKPILEVIYELNHEMNTMIKLSISTNIPLKRLRSAHRKCFDSGYVDYLGFLPHKQSIENLMSSHLLTAFFANNLSTEGSYPGKIFEYFRTGRPILLLNNHTSDVARLIKDTNTGKSVNINDKIEIKAVIMAYYHQWLHEGDLEYKPNLEIIQGYNYKNIIKQIDILFSEE